MDDRRYQAVVFRFLQTFKKRDMFFLKKSAFTISWKLHPQLFYEEKFRCQFRNVQFPLNCFKTFTYIKTCNHRIEILEENISFGNKSF